MGFNFFPLFISMCRSNDDLLSELWFIRKFYCCLRFTLNSSEISFMFIPPPFFSNDFSISISGINPWNFVLDRVSTHMSICHCYFSAMKLTSKRRFEFSIAIEKRFRYALFFISPNKYKNYQDLCWASRMSVIAQKIQKKVPPLYKIFHLFTLHTRGPIEQCCCCCWWEGELIEFRVEHFVRVKEKEIHSNIQKRLFWTFFLENNENAMWGRQPEIFFNTKKNASF